jgi:hypothetical protein
MSVAPIPTPDKVVVLALHQRIPITYCKKSSTFALRVSGDDHRVDIEGLARFFKSIQPLKGDFGWQERDGATGKPCGWYCPHGKHAYNWSYDRWYEAKEELMRL